MHDGFNAKVAISSFVAFATVQIALPIFITDKLSDESQSPSGNILYKIMADSDAVSAATVFVSGGAKVYGPGPGGEPAALDLNGDGNLSVLKPSMGMPFDYDDSGIAPMSSWTDEEDGVLAIDLNNNNKIDGEKELVGQNNMQSFDSNNDGIIDAQDSKFDKLRILRKSGKITKIDEEGIVSIDTKTKVENFKDEYGNYKFASGTFKKKDGKTYKYEEYIFATDYTNVIETNLIKETEEVKNLPDIKNIGKVHSLHQAMLRDKKLLSLVRKFVEENSEAKRDVLVSQITERLTGSYNVKSGSRGKHIDAKHIATVEAFMANKAVENPDFIQAYSFETLYQKFESYIYAELMSQSHVKDLMKLVKNNNDGYDVSAVIKQLNKEIEINERAGNERALMFSKTIQGLSFGNR